MPAPTPAPKKPADRLPTNPSGARFADLKHEDGPFFLVLSHVGPHNPAGHAGPLVVSARELGEGADLQRLVHLGVIVPAPDELADEYLEALPAFAEGEPQPVVVEKAPVPAPAPAPQHPLPPAATVVTKAPPAPAPHPAK